MADKPIPSEPQSPGPDHVEGTPPAKTAVKPKGASAKATDVWERKAGPFGRNPVPGD